MIKMCFSHISIHSLPSEIKLTKFREPLNLRVIRAWFISEASRSLISLIQKPPLCCAESRQNLIVYNHILLKYIKTDSTCAG